MSLTRRILDWVLTRGDQPPVVDPAPPAAAQAARDAAVDVQAQATRDILEAAQATHQAAGQVVDRLERLIAAAAREQAVLRTTKGTPTSAPARRRRRPNTGAMRCARS